jgi:hypothetical protein
MSEQNAIATRGALAETYGTIAAHTLEIDRLFIERPYLRPYFYGGKDLSKADKETYHRVMAMAEFQLDAFDAIMTQRDYLPDDKDKQEDLQTWQRYFEDSFTKSPALCERISWNPDWYMTSLVNIAHAKCQKRPDFSGHAAAP